MTFMIWKDLLLIGHAVMIRFAFDFKCVSFARIWYIESELSSRCDMICFMNVDTFTGNDTRCKIDGPFLWVLNWIFVFRSLRSGWDHRIFIRSCFQRVLAHIE